MPASAALGRNARTSVKNSITTVIVPAATRLGNWLFAPEASIAAEREGLVPVTSEPMKPAARLAAPPPAIFGVRRSSPDRSESK